MFTLSVRVYGQLPSVDKKALGFYEETLIRELSEEYVKQVREALVSSRKVVSGETRDSIRYEMVEIASSRGRFQAKVTAAKSLTYIIDGRRAGAPYPVMFDNNLEEANSKGRLRVVPQPRLREWFLALHIPYIYWFPIIRKIAERGIAPVDIMKMARSSASPEWAKLLDDRAKDMATVVITRKNVSSQKDF